MSGLASQFRTNIIYGAIALLPVAVLVYILVKLFGFLKKLAEPLSPYLRESLDNLTLADVCFGRGPLVLERREVIKRRTVDDRH